MNYSSDNSESDLDGECPAEPVNTGFTSSGMIKDDHRIYDQSPYENIYSWFYYSQSLHDYMCKICEIYYGSSPCPANSNRGAWSHKPVTLHDMLVKSYSAMIPQKFINKPFLVWRISASKIPLVHGQKRKAKSDMKPTICTMENWSVLFIFLLEIIYLSQAFIKNS